MPQDRPRQLLSEVMVNLASATDAILELKDHSDPVMELAPSVAERMLERIVRELDATWDDPRPKTRAETLAQLDRAVGIAARRGWNEMEETLARLRASLIRLTEEPEPPPAQQGSPPGPAQSTTAGESNGHRRLP